MSPVRIDRTGKPVIRRGQGSTASIQVPGVPGPAGPAGPGGSDSGVAGYVNDTTPSQTRSAINGAFTQRANNLSDLTNAATARTNLGAAATAHNHAAADITSGTVATARLGTGVADATKFLRGDNTWAAVSGGGGGLLAATQYNPGTFVQYSTTSTTLVDVDATNLVITFTAPASGAVILVLSAMTANSSASQITYWSVADLEALLINGPSRIDLRGVYRVRVTGLTSGTSYTYKWRFRTTGGSTGYITAGGGYGSALMEVWPA